ncbi:MAG: oxygen-independent coproporphyrinogen III oxidase-like protein [Gammaproteobacteria bacterium]|nr:oxygen-independent coproporphyrinogen III oxidase-like protein [Gammaproteobacteria bacterium]
MLNFTTLPPLSLYIHYPWCARKCPYCDFNSHAVPGNTDKQHDLQRDEQYVAALISDLEQELPAIWGRSIHSIFIGGGTPSLIQPEAMQHLLSQIRARLQVSPLAEITMEANPGTVDQLKFAEFRQAGINRLSMGIQSFDDQLLQKIGRIHNGQQARQAIERAQLAGFENINLDLMYALPGQTLASALDDVQQAIAFQTTHLSHYQLTLEANTLFASQPPRLPDDDLSYEMQHQCQQLLADAGFHHYEISAYAKAGRECAHNLNYWQFGDYLGIGAGAHGKISDAARQTITRRWKLKHPQSYMDNSHGFKPVFASDSTNKQTSCIIGGEQQLSRHDIGFEFMLNASRLTGGFDSELFYQQTGLAITQIEKGLQKAVELELIEWHLHHIRPTERGLQYLNELQAIFL